MTERTAKAPNFTPAQEQAIRDAAPLNQAKSRALAAEFGKSERSVTAKAVRMGVAYERKQPTTKSGAPVERKEAIVAQIADLVEGNLDGLEKAPKAALQAVRNALVA
jgi:hypothetical protein